MLNHELEKEVITLRVQNRYTALQLQNIQNEIEHFSAQYYSAIEDICISLAEIEGKMRLYDKKIAALTSATKKDVGGYNNIQPRESAVEKIKLDSIKNEPINLEDEVKNLYRSLIKIVHPDVSEEKLKASEYTMMVNKAYNERNYRQLLELDQIIRSGNATEAELRQQRNKLVDSTFEMKIQREDLLENPLYILSEQFADAEDDGVEMMQEVRAKLHQRVQNRKRDLRNKKLEYLETVGNIITTKENA